MPSRSGGGAASMGAFRSLVVCDLYRGWNDRRLSWGGCPPRNHVQQELALFADWRCPGFFGNGNSLFIGGPSGCRAHSRLRPFDYSTDLILVKEEDLSRAVRKLSKAGHRVFSEKSHITLPWWTRKKSRSPFDTSGWTAISACNYLNFRSWWGIEPWTESGFMTFYKVIFLIPPPIIPPSINLTEIRRFLIVPCQLRVLNWNFCAWCIDLMSPDWGVWSL